MGKRTNTAVWEEKYQRWRIAVQKDGVRKQFYSSTPGRTGQREANAKADAWLEDGIAVKASRVEQAGKLWLASVELTTSHTNYRPRESRWRVWVLPVIGQKRVTALTDQDLQNVVDHAQAGGLSRKTLQSLAGDLTAFCKYCRKAKLSTFRPEDVVIPAGARLKGKKVLQPDALAKLFQVDTTLYYRKRIQDPYINAYRFQVLTGLRPGELLGLRWADIRGDTVQGVPLNQHRGHRDQRQEPKRRALLCAHRSGQGCAGSAAPAYRQQGQRVPDPDRTALLRPLAHLLQSKRHPAGVRV